jgi:hypothetical protein
MTGVCEDAMLCADVDCSDDNDCTDDVCDPLDGSCDNPNVEDGTSCDFEGLPGVCMTGVCEDAMLCAEVDCSDDNDCTDDVCDPMTGDCSNPNVEDGTSCDFGGLPGECMTGVCEDAMLCADVDCSDGNDCTDDVCDPMTGDCSNPDSAAGTACDAGGNAGECDGAGMCVALCTPTAGLMVPLPTSGAPTPTYTDMTNGFTISAVNCQTPLLCDVTSSFRGIGSNAFGDGIAFDGSDSLLISFFDQDGNSQTASNVSLLLHPQGIGGTVDVRVDGGGASSVLTTPGAAVVLSVASAKDIEVTSTGGFIFWQQLDYDHDCL